MMILITLFFILNLFAGSILCLYSTTSPVKILNSQAFQSIKKSSAPHVVEFFASWCGHCKAFAPEYEKAAKALKHIIPVVAVEDESVMQTEGIKGFPIVMLYMAKGSTPIMYPGPRTADALVAFVMKELTEFATTNLSGPKKKTEKSSKRAKSDVIEITDNSFHQLVTNDEKSVWFIEFYAPWCGHCKNLAPIWESVATKLKGSVKVGKIDATQQVVLAQKYGIRGFPTIFIFPSGIKDNTTAIRYEGPRSEDELISFAISFSSATTEIKQLISQEILEDECQKKVCVISILPNILDSKASGRMVYLDELKKAVKSTAGKPITFLWMEGGQNLSFEESLNLQFGYPAVIAVHFEKKKYAIHKGYFKELELRLFVSSLMGGRQVLHNIPENLPKLATVKPWDGKDGELPPNEDVFDEHDEF